MRAHPFVRLVCLFTALGFLACNKPQEPAAGSSAPVSAPIEVDHTDSSRRPQMVTSFAPVVNKVGGSVVNVFTTKRVRLPDQSALPLDDPFFRYFFGQPAPRQQPPLPHFREQMGLGSGVIISSEGYVLTNNHVIDVADDIKVLLGSGKREFAAEVVGKDPRTDIAVLRLKGAKDLPSITVGDSDRSEVGDVVLAIGNPFGVGQTVTMGIISALGRNLPPTNGETSDMIANFIQTDAPINPGNSGGALVDTQGRLIGINSAILSGSGGGSVGIGFAIPINLAKNIMNQLIKNGKVTRGSLGVNIQAVTPSLARQFGVQDLSGALVASVVPGGAASAAGVKPGDVIIAYNGKEVLDTSALRVQVTQTPPGTTVSMRIIRDGRPKSLEVTINSLDEKDLRARAEENGHDAENGDQQPSGLKLSELNGETRRQFRIPPGVDGILVQDLAQDSIAAHYGIRPGDVIEQVNRSPAKSIRQVAEALDPKKGTPSVLLVWNAMGSRYVALGD